MSKKESFVKKHSDWYNKLFKSVQKNEDSVRGILEFLKSKRDKIKTKKIIRKGYRFKGWDWGFIKEDNDAKKG